MGENTTFTGGSLFAEDQNGGRLCFGDVKIDESKEPVDPLEDTHELIKLCESKATFTITPLFPRMSRKRFIKKLMAMGYPRNFARDMAEYARCECFSYSACYFRMRLRSLALGL